MDLGTNQTRHWSILGKLRKAVRKGMVESKAAVLLMCGQAEGVSKLAIVFTIGLAAEKEKTMASFVTPSVIPVSSE